MLYKGYIATHGKKAAEKFRDRTDFKTLDEARMLPSYAGVLAEDAILIDIDDHEQSEKAFDIVTGLSLRCRVIETTRGKHFLFTNKNHVVTKCYTHVQLACGLTADIKVGSKNSYEVIKIDGTERPVLWDLDAGEEYEEVPDVFLPVKGHKDFVDMEAGDGRNQEMFNYILTLSSCGFDKDRARNIIRIINNYVFEQPMDQRELETVLRDESFQKPSFYDADNKFLFNEFAQYMVQNNHIVSIGQQMHVYEDGIYVPGYRHIEAQMIDIIPTLRKAQRKEVLEYMELIVKGAAAADARYIAFNNGIYDVSKREMINFSPDMIITNRIPWNYNPDAYNALADHTLNRLACDDPTIRALLEECIGYCFYRRNEMGKAFILTGDKSNGKSTFLDVVKTILGENNISALDVHELGDRFSTAMLFGKLANIGDDIGDEFLQGQQVAVFKKIVTGNRIKAEQKGQDPFEFNPYVKLLFSANDIPRMRDKTGAVLRRLVIIPFNAHFTKNDPDYKPFIRTELEKPEAIEYFIRLGIEGLQRILEPGRGFTTSNAVEKEVQEYREENNPLIGFIADQGTDAIIGQATGDVYRRYQVYCANNGMTQPLSANSFSRAINRQLDTETKVTTINGVSHRIFVEAKHG